MRLMGLPLRGGGVQHGSRVRPSLAHLAPRCACARPAGVPALDRTLHAVLTPALAIPQALNLLGGALFAGVLPHCPISVAGPVANSACCASWLFRRGGPRWELAPLRIARQRARAFRRRAAVVS